MYRFWRWNPDEAEPYPNNNAIAILRKQAVTHERGQFVSLQTPVLHVAVLTLIRVLKPSTSWYSRLCITDLWYPLPLWLQAPHQHFEQAHAPLS